MPALLETTTETFTCYHCGNEADVHQVINRDGHAFCCQGCESVYQILAENDLCTFYDINQEVRKPVASGTSAYYILDQDEIASDLLDFRNDQLSKVTLFLPAIHCSSCIWLLEHLQRLNAGVVSAQVQFLKKEISVIFQHGQISLRQLAELLASIGYPPRIVRKAEHKTGSASKSMVMRLAVAGFCFGNSMLISLPEYLDIHLDERFRGIFGVVNLVLALPVFFYSAGVFFGSAWRGLKGRFVNIDVPLSIGIAALFLRSVIDIGTGAGSGFVDSLSGLVFFLLIGRWFQDKTYQALSFERDYKSYFPIAVTRLVDGMERIVKLEEVQVDDELLIRNMELIPADARLIAGDANIDYAFVTGESVPARVVLGERVYAGGRQIGGPISVRVEKSVDNSYLTKLWNTDTHAQKGGERLSSISDRVSKYFTLVVLALGAGAAFYWWQVDHTKVLHVFTSVLIVACACAPALAVPFTYGYTMRVFGRLGLYIKNPQVIEKMSHLSTIVFDKTGTLTRPLPEQVTYDGGELSAAEEQMVKGATHNSVHPLSRIIYRHLSAELPVAALSDFKEVPGNGIAAKTNGHTIRLGSWEWAGAGAKPTDASTRVHVNIDGVYRGAYVFTNVYRKDAFRMIDKLGDFDLHLLSGDHDGERTQLAPYFGALHFRQSPQDKLQYVQQLNQQGRKTLMVGDGLNDAGALRHSYVGMSLTDDIYQFSPACDAILDADRLTMLPRFLKFSRVAYFTVWAAFLISFSYNAVGLSFAITGHLTPLVSAILMPISSVSIVTFIWATISLAEWRWMGNGSSNVRKG